MDQGDGLKPFYKNLEDTLEHTELTKRQIDYWRSKGLFQPSLGPKTRYYTEQDIGRLLFLKRLIVDLQLQVETVKSLFDQQADQAAKHPERFPFLDLWRGKLVEPSDAVKALLGQAVEGASEREVERWFLELGMMLFDRAREQSRSPKEYAAKRDGIYERLARMELAARAHGEEQDEEAGFWPKFDTDPTLTGDEFDELLDQRERVLAPVRQARVDRHQWQDARSGRWL